MDRKYMVNVYASVHSSATELSVWAEDSDDALEIVADMVKTLGGDIKRAFSVTVELDD